MKYRSLFTYLLFLCLITASLTGIADNMKQIGESTTQIELTYQFSLPKITSYEQDGTSVHKINIDNLPLSGATGKPMLPVKPIRILLPNGHSIQDIQIHPDQSSLTFSSVIPQLGSHIIPLQTLNKNTIQTVQKEITNDDLYSVTGTYIMKGYSILFITLHPVTYDQEILQLTYYPSLSISIETKQDGNSNKIRNLESDKIQVGQLVENPEVLTTYETGQTSTLQEATYLIITNEQLKNSGYEDTFQYLLYTKSEKGMTGRIVTVEEILSDASFSVNGTWGDNNPSNPFYQQPITENYQRFDDTQARIRNYIRYAYSELGTQYVLLGGDGDTNDPAQNIIPARGLFANESGLPLLSSGVILAEEEDDIPSDVYYACLDGNFNYDMDEHFGESKDRNNISLIDEADLLSEVSVGRACVDSELEVANFVSKTLSYENREESPFLKKVLFVGEYLGFPGISAYGGNYKDLVRPYIPESYNLVTLYDRDLPSSWNKNDMIEIINNATPHIINHDGHSNYGYNLKMRNSDIESLTNIDNFFLYSHGCNAGGFDNPSGYDCIAERLNVETLYGFFAGIMNARYGLGSENNLDSPSLALDISFFKALFNESIRQIGPANHYSKEDNVWQIDENGIRWVYYETNLFGDPEIAIHDPSNTIIEFNVEINKPKSEGIIYLKGNEIISLPFLQHPILIGSCIIEADASSNPEGYIYSVEFFVDDQSYHIDTSYPYQWEIDIPLKGIHTLTVIAHGRYGEIASTSMAISGWIREK